MDHGAESSADDAERFSLVLGGPFYQFLRRIHLVAPPTLLVNRRIFASILITWVPLAILAAIEGTFYGGVNVPFISDLGNTRFLVALPLLIAAEVIVHRRIRLVVAQFQNRDVILPEEQERFESYIDKATNLRNSIAAELILVLFSFTVGHWLWSEHGSLHVSTWYTISRGASPQLSYAGYWFAFVSLPIIRFILLRWYFRLFIWYLFLWRVSRLKLQLNALHPDRAGGIGFLSGSIVALTPMLIAQSCFLSAQIGNEILHEGAQLQAFQFVIAGFLLFLMLTVLLPLIFFAFPLVEAKLVFSRDYGAVASRYVVDFRKKWMARNERANEGLLGTADIQSLADLSNSFEVVRTMRMFPFDKSSVVRLAIALVLPMLPLLATVFSSKELAERILRLLI